MKIAKGKNITLHTFLDGGELESAAQKLMAAWGKGKLNGAAVTIQNVVQLGAANSAADVDGGASHESEPLQAIADDDPDRELKRQRKQNAMLTRARKIQAAMFPFDADEATAGKVAKELELDKNKKSFGNA